MKLALPSSLENHYEMLRLLYTGCQVVHGNLEITHLQGSPDLSFLQGIVEVQGYVLIAHVSVRSVPLENLRIIRGSQLYNSSYALAVHNNIHHSQTGLGLREIRLRSLTEILLGGVYIWGNPQLCFPRNINWEDTVTKVENKPLHLQDIPKNCPLCSSACPSNSGCWGETNQDCQTLTSVQCSSGCLRCKGPKPNDCCHVQCAAGCTGPKDTDCLACRHFNDSGTCKDNCPPPNIYDPNTFQSKPNKDKKFSFGATCVKQCPHNYLAMEVACTMVCPKANMEVITDDVDGQKTQKCEKCEGECPKVCYGLGMGNLQGVSVVDATNIGMFVGCEKIYGSLAFLTDSFKVNAATNSSGLQWSDLEKLKTIEEITGYLYIDAWPDNLPDLSVFENLKIIRGRMLYKCPLDDRGCPIQKKTGPGTTVAVTVGGVLLFIILLALLVFYLRRQKQHKRKETMRRILQEHENDDQKSLSSPVDSEFFRTLLAEEGGNVKELLDAEEYLVPQPGGIFNTQGEMRANGPSRHHSHRVRDD
ncbi:hypothetical protein cypCar_00035697 [Cyprinus carpio]|nr:hypothetical protein cypCar_00035697 [Cyprinus carpio]